MHHNLSKYQEKNPKSFKIYFCDQESLAQYLVKDQIGIMRYLPTFLGHTLVVVVVQNDVSKAVEKSGIPQLTAEQPNLDSKAVVFNGKGRDLEQKQKNIHSTAAATDIAQESKMLYNLLALFLSGES